MKKVLFLAALWMAPVFATGQPVNSPPAKTLQSTGQPDALVSGTAGGVKTAWSEDDKNEARKERRSHRKAVQHRARRRG